MRLSPRPFGSRSGGRLGVICSALRPPREAIRSVRDTAHSFDLKQLSSDLCRNMALPWPFTVQCLVARATGDQGLAAVRDHPLDPQGFVLAAWLVQIR